MDIKPCLKKGNVCIPFIGLMIGFTFNIWADIILGSKNTITIFFEDSIGVRILAGVVGSYLGHLIARR